MRTVAVSCLFVLVLLCDLHAQRGGDEYMPPDSLTVQHEYWIGVAPSAMFSLFFGSLSAKYAGGSAPGSQPQLATTSGGTGLAGGLGVVGEYRPYGDRWSVFAIVGAEYRYASSTTPEPISNGIYAINAQFEIVSKAWYLTVSPSFRYQVGRTGAFVYGGVSAELPVASPSTVLWQHELPTGDTVSSEPSQPATNILFKTNIILRPRFGIHVGVGHDYLVGLFGYRRQLITPFVELSAGTPYVKDETWNSVGIRIGVMWRYGF